MKHLRGYRVDGMTFGMDIDTMTPAYRAMKKATERRKIVGHYGIEFSALVCPAQYVAGIMREAGWLVSEAQDFQHITINGGEEIFIEYPDGIHL